MKPVVLLLFFAVLVASCASQQAPAPQPANPEFGLDKYLTAEASGKTEGEAKQAAMAELAAIFQSKVRSEVQSRAQTVVSVDESEQFEKQVDQMIRIESDVRLEGARIGWVKPDTAAGGFRALAVLDRAQAAGRWHGALERVQSEMDAGLQSLPAVNGRLPRLSALNRLTALSAEKTLIESRLSVIGRPAMPDEEQDLTAVFAERGRLMENATMAMQIEGDGAEGFTHALGSLITAQGLRLISESDDAAGIITGKAWAEPLALRNSNAQFYRALAEISIVDQDTGKVIAAFSENARKGHLDENEAVRMAFDQLARQTAQRLVETLGIIGLDTAPEGAVRK